MPSAPSISRAADAVPAPLGQHRERGHVRLVDHQPHAAVGDCLVAGPDDQVVRQAVGLQLLAERVVGPRRREAGRLDAGGRRRRPRARIGSMRTFSGGRATIPSPPLPSRCRAAAPRTPATSCATSSDCPPGSRAAPSVASAPAEPATADSPRRMRRAVPISSRPRRRQRRCCVSATSSRRLLFGRLTVRDLDAVDVSVGRARGQRDRDLAVVASRGRGASAQRRRNADDRDRPARRQSSWPWRGRCAGP